MEGLETLCEVNKFNQELLNIYIEKIIMKKLYYYVKK